MKNHTEFTFNEFYCVVAAVDAKACGISPCRICSEGECRSKSAFEKLVGLAGVCTGQLLRSREDGRPLYRVSLHDHGETEYFLDGEILRITKAEFDKVNAINSRHSDDFREFAWSNENPF